MQQTAQNEQPVPLPAHLAAKAQTLAPYQQGALR
jgi:hypothetical protein